MNETPEAIRRQALADAIAAAQGERLQDNTGRDDDNAYNQAVDDIVRAIQALAEGQMPSAEHTALPISQVPLIPVTLEFAPVDDWPAETRHVLLPAVPRQGETIVYQLDPEDAEALWTVDQVALSFLEDPTNPRYFVDLSYCQ